MRSVSDRHEGDLEGQLGRWDQRRPLRVQIVLDETSRLPAVQHTAWMLVNLLARMEGVVSGIYVSGPAAALAERVVPLGSDAAEPGPGGGEPNLIDALLAGAAEIDVVAVMLGTDAETDIVIEVGPGRASGDRLRVHGDGWAGGIALQGSLPAGRWSALPLGPYAAACLAAARVFLVSRAPGLAAEEELREPLVWSIWSLRGGGSELLGDGPAALQAALDAGLAGVGAVGAAAMHASWATRGASGTLLAVDADRLGVDQTSLNRGIVFVRNSVGEQKAHEAARRLAGAELGFVARQGRYEAQSERPALLLSAVDRNEAREALQAQYPARAIGASTHGLRVELLRTGPPGAGACLRCYNEPEPTVSDEALRARIREATPAELVAVADRARITVEEARGWAAAGGCGSVDAAMLRVLRADGNGVTSTDEPVEEGEFAVAFVSVFAGTLLTGEALKEAIGADAPIGDGANRVSFQFARPRAVKGPHFLARDPRCPACRPGPARENWLSRRERWGTGRP